MPLYLSSGYVNIEYCLNFKCPFTFIIGGRGTGKTFTSQLVCIQKNLTYMLLRRTQAQADLIAKPEFSPVNPVLEYLHRIPYIESATKYNGKIYSNLLLTMKIKYCTGIPVPCLRFQILEVLTGLILTFFCLMNLYLNAMKRL